jgi:hypothetical protein
VDAARGSRYWTSNAPCPTPSFAPARCSLHEDRERDTAFSDLLYYAILVILELSHFSSDLLCVWLQL